VYDLVRVQVERKFQRKKQVMPGEHDVKIYMRMAALAGFGWTIGFILFILPDGQHGFERYLAATFRYLFILLNATPGLFIFGVYVCNKRVFTLYRQLFVRIYEFIRVHLWQCLVNCWHISISRIKMRFNQFRLSHANMATVLATTTSMSNVVQSPSNSSSWRNVYDNRTMRTSQISNSSSSE
jgi:hypothetical protein